MSKTAKRNAMLVGIAGLALLLLSAFTVLRGTRQSATFEFPLAVGNSWLYTGTATYGQGDTETTQTATGSIEIPRQLGVDTFQARLKGLIPDKMPQITTGTFVRDALGVILNQRPEGRGSGFLIPKTLEVGQIFSLRLDSGDIVWFFLVHSVSESVQVPAGTFNDAIQLNFSLEGDTSGTRAKASGKIFLVSDIGIVMIEGIFNGGDIVGQASIQLSDYSVF